MKKLLLLGDEAIALGAIHAGLSAYMLTLVPRRPKLLSLFRAIS